VRSVDEILAALDADLRLGQQLTLT
jgi:hypothetical protein